MAPKKQQSKSEGGGKKNQNNKGGNKATTTSNGDDDCADMPPLEDMRKTDATAGRKGKDEQGEKGAKEGKENVKLPEPRWSEGQTPLGVAFATKDVREAYRMLDVDTKLSDEKLLPILHDKLTNLFIGSETKQSYEAVGSALLIACSRASTINSVLFPIVQKVYTYEANHHLAKLKLPMLKDETTLDKPLLVAGVCTETMSYSQFKEIKSTYEPNAQERARLALAEKEAKESKGELEKMKIELVDYKAEVKEGYKARDEKAVELEKVLSREEKAKSELEKRDEKVAELEQELAKLRASPSSSTSAQVASSDKASFVIKSLSRQVRDLGRQVKEKNDQLGEWLSFLHEIDRY
ncbi:hypothetical protein JCM5353_008647 [Sporobolomyces roseus]